MQNNENKQPKRPGLKKDLYKTELCANWTKTGFCRYGPKCQFAHGLDDIKIVVKNEKYKTRVCTQYKKTGYCKYGSRCLFLHDPHDKELFYEMSKEAHFRSRSLTEENKIPSILSEKSPSVERSELKKEMLETVLAPTNPTSGTELQNSLLQQTRFSSSSASFKENSSFHDIEEDDVYDEEKKFCLRNNVYSPMLGFEFEKLTKDETSSGDE